MVDFGGLVARHALEMKRTTSRKFFRHRAGLQDVKDRPNTSNDISASWQQLGCSDGGLAPPHHTLSWQQLSCLAALLVISGTKISIFWWLWHHENIAFVLQIIGYRAIWPFWYSGTKIMDFGGLRQSWGNQPVGPNGLAR